MRAAARALTLVVIVVLAGCNAPLADSGTETPVDDEASTVSTPAEAETPVPTPEQAGTDSLDPGEQALDPDERPRPTTVDPPGTVTPDTVQVTGDDAPVEAGRVFARVERVLGTQADPPDVRVAGDFGGGSRSIGQQDDPFEEQLGIGPPQRVSEAEGAVQVGGATFPSGDVTIADLGGTPRDFERTLAHEYAHVVQFDLGAMEWVTDGIPAERRDTTDGQLTEQSVVEGGATYLATQYGLRYMQDFNTETTQILRLYRNGTAGTRLLWAPYLYGSLYIENRIDSPGLLWTVYRLPPDTTEQVLHGGHDDPAPLDVESTTDYGDEWTVEERDSRGELFTRIALRTQLDAERAAEAATGWGNDRLLTYERDFDEHAFVWTLRWDDAENATEFREAFESSLDERGTNREDRWRVDGDEYRLVTVDDRTVAVVTGPTRFVVGTAVTARGDTVAVSRPEDDTAIAADDEERRDDGPGTAEPPF